MEKGEHDMLAWKLKKKAVNLDGSRVYVTVKTQPQATLWYLKVIADGHTVVAGVQRILKGKAVSLCKQESLKPEQQTVAFKPASVLKHNASVSRDCSIDLGLLINI